MKHLITMLAVILAAFAIAAFAQSYRRTIDDMYSDSYATAMKQHLVNADVRASEYDANYQPCDENHDCGVAIGMQKQPLQIMT